MTTMSHDHEHDAGTTTDTMPPDEPKKTKAANRTAQGREASKANATRHGLSSKEIFPPELAEAIARYTAIAVDEFQPRTDYERSLVGEIGMARAKIERAGVLIGHDLGRTMYRAGACWDSDRREAIDNLGAKLSKDPKRVHGALRRTKQGCTWLIECWAELAEVLETNGGFDDAQRQWALDLLGVSPQARNGSKRLPSSSDGAALSRLVGWERERLEGDIAEWLEATDARRRESAQSGMSMEEDAETRRLHRHLATAKRERDWAMAELRASRAGLNSGASPAPAATPTARTPARPGPPRVPPPPEPAAAPVSATASLADALPATTPMTESESFAAWMVAGLPDDGATFDPILAPMRARQFKGGTTPWPDLLDAYRGAVVGRLAGA
jgi:hypothetical protein